MPKVVPGYTIQSVTAAECKGITFSRQTDGSGSTVVVATGEFEMKDEQARVVGSGSVSLQLSAAQRTQLNTFVTANLAPAFNSQEGL